MSTSPFAIGPGPGGGEEENDRSRFSGTHLHLAIQGRVRHVHLGHKHTIATRQQKLDLGWQVCNCLKDSCGSGRPYEHASPPVFGWWMVPLLPLYPPFLANSRDQAIIELRVRSCPSLSLCSLSLICTSKTCTKPPLNSLPYAVLPSPTALSPTTTRILNPPLPRTYPQLPTPWQHARTSPQIYV